ncbi:MAG: hypothetical protein Q8L78_07850 [Coxiellaceae bacterium]|nr:hypothetical protein [Coxiellaceae bacterium]
MRIFSETMVQAVGEYRGLLRRYLSQVERMVKLQQLGLRDSDLYENEVALYHMGLAIIEDIKANMAMENPSYYAYSGVQQFCEHLQEYLSNYAIENGRVVHRAQRASRAVLDAVQWMGMSRERLDEGVLKKFLDCNKTVVVNGSKEQCDLLLQTLSRQQAANPGFYTRIIAHLESLLAGRSQVAV